VSDQVPGDAAFDRFVAEVEPSLRRALVAAYGADVGRDATAEALAWAWEHWEKLHDMVNPIGYLYRVGQTRRPRVRSASHAFPPVALDSEVWIEPGLPSALASLTEHQRTATVLVHGFGWSLQEVAGLLGVKVTTVQNHVERGLRKLRARLEVSTDAR
jgi:DNA-directed RNA polymerase specialized sigma24 family protein